MGWNDFSLAAVGCWYDNEDGTSRQAELARLTPGEEIALIREPENPHGRNAVAIFSARGIRVGYIGKERSVWIASKIDRDYPVRAIVQRVKGRDLPDATLGLVMRINLDGEMPELPAPDRGPLDRDSCGGIRGGTSLPLPAKRRGFPL